MFFELRQYTLWPGKQAAFVKLMDEVIIPFQTSVGMDIRGSWVAEEDETQFFWIRAFQSEASGSVSTPPSTTATRGRTRSRRSCPT